MDLHVQLVTLVSVQASELILRIMLHMLCHSMVCCPICVPHTDCNVWLHYTLLQSQSQAWLQIDLDLVTVQASWLTTPTMPALCVMWLP